METGLVFDKRGGVIYWHCPPDRSQGFLPDSRNLWNVLWANRMELGGFVHTHPWDGPSVPSGTDITTFAAIEAALGQRLVWPVVTFTDVGYYEWTGPGVHDYDLMSIRRFRLPKDCISKIRELSR